MSDADAPPLQGNKGLQAGLWSALMAFSRKHCGYLVLCCNAEQAMPITVDIAVQKKEV